MKGSATSKTKAVCDPCAKVDEFDIRRYFRVTDVRSQDDAIKAVAKVVPEGDLHPWTPSFKASRPVALAKIRGVGWTVAVEYTGGAVGEVDRKVPGDE